VFQDFIQYVLSAGDNIALGRHERAADTAGIVRAAALDAKAEHELFAKIGELFADRSVLLISHRFSTVRSADRSYVLHEGRVVEDGTHSELVALGGTYAELFTLQASPYQ
jgi:ATP-binding cassette, subfamily B, bacterial